MVFKGITETLLASCLNIFMCCSHRSSMWFLAHHYDSLGSGEILSKSFSSAPFVHYTLDRINGNFQYKNLFRVTDLFDCDYKNFQVFCNSTKNVLVSFFTVKLIKSFMKLNFQRFIFQIVQFIVKSFQHNMISISFKIQYFSNNISEKLKVTKKDFSEFVEYKV